MTIKEAITVSERPWDFTLDDLHRAQKRLSESDWSNPENMRAWYFLSDFIAMNLF